MLSNTCSRLAKRVQRQLVESLLANAPSITVA